MKGYQGITDMLNLPSLDEVLREQGIDANEQTAGKDGDDVNEAEVAKTLGKLNDLSARVAATDGVDHSDAMDDLYREILNHARELMQYGYNMDQPRARGIFEVAATLYNHAMSAANSKRDAQLKTLKLGLERKRVELEERRTNHALGQQAATMDANNTIIVEDRNELIRRLREQVNK